ncbi:TRAP transporter substrate-binding protein DctP [Salicibibacter kimchii]|uniref:TRAP transporter substrate-binding protein DctP n=1 Tax=Salicibibacter kimchii TaxID=2099786 RepID=A0A345C175_9BACI|nr:TRAP transporter substrate-binding protein DctP [Salicibibacter kimchii]AXF56956.1 hypothetical protein DT065_13720 [Salicibibacter kimchii]
MGRNNLKLILLKIISALAIFVAGCGSDEVTTEEENDSSVDEPVTLTIVSFVHDNHPLTRDVIPMWMEQIEEGTDGAVQLEWTGGPESIPTGEQFDAVSSGVADITFNTSSFYGHLMPESLSMLMSPYSPAEERENGYFDYLNSRHEEQNQVYLGRFLGPNPFYFWSNEQMKSLDDFENLNFRSNPTYHEILEELNTTVTDIEPGEVYTALDRNMVDGFGFTLMGPHEDGWTEVTRYIIDEPFLNQNGTILINKDTFESLPSDLQETMKDITAEFEKDMIDYFHAENETTWETIEAEGIERIELTDEDSERFQEIVHDVYWEMLERDAPDEIDNLRELLLDDEFDVTSIYE